MPTAQAAIERAFEEAMRIALEIVAILERPRLALVDVDRHQARRGSAATSFHLRPAGNPAPPRPRRPGVFHHRDDVVAASFRRQRSRGQRVSALGAIRRVADVTGRDVVGDVGVRRGCVRVADLAPPLSRPSRAASGSDRPPPRARFRSGRRTARAARARRCRAARAASRAARASRRGRRRSSRRRAR